MELESMVCTLYTSIGEDASNIAVTTTVIHIFINIISNIVMLSLYFALFIITWKSRQRSQGKNKHHRKGTEINVIVTIVRICSPVIVSWVPYLLALGIIVSGVDVSQYVYNWLLLVFTPFSSGINHFFYFYQLFKSQSSTKK